jgi:hypothetical protein
VEHNTGGIDNPAQRWTLEVLQRLKHLAGDASEIDRMA